MPARHNAPQTKLTNYITLYTHTLRRIRTDYQHCLEITTMAKCLKIDSPSLQKRLMNVPIAADSFNSSLRSLHSSCYLTTLYPLKTLRSEVRNTTEHLDSSWVTANQKTRTRMEEQFIMTPTPTFVTTLLRINLTL